MTNFIPEKDKKAKTPIEQPNTKASALSDDELDNVSGGATILKPGRPVTDNEADDGALSDDALDGVSGGVETLRAEAKTDEEQVDEDNESYGNPPTRGYTQLK